MGRGRQTTASQAEPGSASWDTWQLKSPSHTRVVQGCNFVPHSPHWLFYPCRPPDSGGCPTEGQLRGERQPVSWRCFGSDEEGSAAGKNCPLAGTQAVTQAQVGTKPGTHSHAQQTQGQGAGIQVQPGTDRQAHRFWRQLTDRTHAGRTNRWHAGHTGQAKLSK